MGRNRAKEIRRGKGIRIQLEIDFVATLGSKKYKKLSVKAGVFCRFFNARFLYSVKGKKAQKTHVFLSRLYSEN